MVGWRGAGVVVVDGGRRRIGSGSAWRGSDRSGRSGREGGRSRPVLAGAKTFRDDFHWAGRWGQCRDGEVRGKASGVGAVSGLSGAPRTDRGVFQPDGGSDGLDANKRIRQARRE